MLIYQIGLTLLPGVGDILGKKLVAYCGGVEEVFRQKRRVLEKIPGIGEKLINAILTQNVLQRAEEEIEFIEKNNITALFYLDNNYPVRLKNCIDSPIMLYYKGSSNLNASKVVSIVGTRQATQYGREQCEKLVSGLVAYDALVVSGLAYGIDTCSHKAALDNGLNTVAVLGHGLDRVYPYLNKGLAEKIIDHGGLISDFLSKTIPDRENFPKRNRIIAGLADAVVVIEAARSGGALITAEIANSYNRDVFAVPGKLGDHFSEGCNFLIKAHKAALMQSVDDLAYIMGWNLDKKRKAKTQRELFITLTDDEEVIVNFLKEKAQVGIDEMCINSGLTMSKIAKALLNLEFQGLVRALPGKVYKLE
nr:DNA-protecting protein DprA [Bacteroidota bacterium]